MTGERAGPREPAPRLEFRAVDYADPVAQVLVSEVQQEYLVRYGEQDVGPVDPTQFLAPHGVFLVALVDGEPVATGAFRAHAVGTAELKRMYVRAAWRGRGIARHVLVELEDRIRAAGLRRVVLETGTAQPEAIALYTSAGYRPVPGFGHYSDAPEQRCFGKELGPVQVERLSPR